MYIILSVFERSQTVVDEINESYFHCCVDILWVKNKRNDPPSHGGPDVQILDRPLYYTLMPFYLQRPNLAQ